MFLQKSSILGDVHKLRPMNIKIEAFASQLRGFCLHSHTTNKKAQPKRLCFFIGGEGGIRTLLKALQEGLLWVFDYKLRKINQYLWNKPCCESSLVSHREGQCRYP